MRITEDIKFIGVDDYEIDLFESQYPVPQGMSYNSYVILDEKIAVMDTVDAGFEKEWLARLEEAVGERKPDFLIIHHMEPDHSANVMKFMERYPETMIVASAKAFEMMKNYFGTDFADQRLVVKEGDRLSLGKHVLQFFAAPMVHWPEVMVTYDSKDKVLFSADAFGKFGALAKNDQWKKEARRYYIGIVSRYGMQVEMLLEKLKAHEICVICPLHGPVLTEPVSEYLELYRTWAKYEPEEDGILIAYTSVYGNTKQAVLRLEQKLKENGVENVVLYDLARCDMTEAVAEAFRYTKLVLATTTYNGDIFPFMRTFLYQLSERNFSNRTVAFIENGSWMPVAAGTMKALLGTNRNLTFLNTTVKILSSMNVESKLQVDTLAKLLAES